MLRRVVITGLGVLAPNGKGREEFWNATIAGLSGVRRISRFDASRLTTQIAGEIPDFDPEAFGLTPEEYTHLGRGTQLALAAANLALHDAGLSNRLSEEERDATGVYMGSAMTSVEEAEHLWVQFTDGGAHSPRLTTKSEFVSAIPLMTHAPAAAIAVHHRLHGPCTSFTTACSAGADAIGQAFWTIQEGYADRMLAGGCDAAITYVGINVFSVIGALSTRNDEPEKASRPYDKERDGFVMSEGAAVLLLAEREIALARNAHMYAEILVFASNSNAHHMTSLPEGGEPLQQLLRQVMQEADIARPDYINAHGSSTLPNERAETTAYKAVFGNTAYSIPISATKSMIGHTQGAASAIETLVTSLALEHQLLPPTINQEFPDPDCDLDYVPHIARPATVNVALTHSSGFGGVNTALLLAHPEWRDNPML